MVRARVTLSAYSAAPAQSRDTGANPKAPMSPNKRADKPFERPELTSTWHKISHNVVVQVTVGVALVGGTAALVIVAFTQ